MPVKQQRNSKFTKVQSVCRDDLCSLILGMVAHETQWGKKEIVVIFKRISEEIRILFLSIELVW